MDELCKLVSRLSLTKANKSHVDKEVEKYHKEGKHSHKQLKAVTKIARRHRGIPTGVENKI